MPNRCGVVNCDSNYDKARTCRIFRLPKDEIERQRWVNALPPRENFVLNPSTFFICEKHWPENVEMCKIPGGSTRPTCPPSLFNVPPSCLPKKTEPRKPKVEDRQLEYFLKKDKITSFCDFQPDKDLTKKYENIVITKSSDKFVCIFMTEDFKESLITIIVHNKATLCSPLTLYAYKRGIAVPLGKLLNPNNGLSSYSQFFEVVNLVFNYKPHLDNGVSKAVEILQSINRELLDDSKEKKLNFIIRQLQLLSNKKYSTNDYCFAIESFPTASYEQLREVISLPCKRKLHLIISATNVKTVVEKTLKKTSRQQKNVFLLIDEVKIRPTIAFSGSVLNGQAKNDPTSKASSMLCIMMRCLHGGPSVMLSVTPVHGLTADYQFSTVKEAAEIIENYGGVVLGSITDNHKINQNFCKLFNRVTDFKAIHPLNDNRYWYLLFDTVHILKCLRNNWISEKCQKLSLDEKTVGNFSDIKSLYQAEKSNILKTTPLTHSAVYPTRLQLQNVQHVLRVFNDKVVAALNIQGSKDTAIFIQQILDWWNTVNVSAKGQDTRMNDPSRAVQQQNSISLLQSFVDSFKNIKSGYGPTRRECLTHDTKKALVQTTEGLLDLSNYLLANGFEYVLLREVQSDRIEGEFSVYRQSTGANAFMAVGDVFNAFKKRLARFAASFLQFVEESVPTSNTSHTCEVPIDANDAAFIENELINLQLTSPEESAAAYVAGWLERKCEDLFFAEDEPFLEGGAKEFIEEVSRGSLKVPHANTYELVRHSLCFMNKFSKNICCRTKLMKILSLIENYFGFQLSNKNLFRRLANVLLHGLQNLEKDLEKNTNLYQTSLKKARMAD